MTRTNIKVVDFYFWIKVLKRGSPPPPLTSGPSARFSTGTIWQTEIGPNGKHGQFLGDVIGVQIGKEPYVVIHKLTNGSTNTFLTEADAKAWINNTGDIDVKLFLADAESYHLGKLEVKLPA
jgi:predicted metallo-beta-lactamase superfamily hydrolase